MPPLSPFPPPHPLCNFSVSLSLSPSFCPLSAKTKGSVHSPSLFSHVSVPSALFFFVFHLPRLLTSLRSLPYPLSSHLHFIHSITPHFSSLHLPSCFLFLFQSLQDPLFHFTCSTHHSRSTPSLSFPPSLIFTSPFPPFSLFYLALSLTFTSLLMN